MAADGSAGAARGRVATAFEVRTVVRLFSETLDFTLDIPGTHYGGLTNAELFAILADQGRDFAKNNRTLRQHVKVEVQNLLDGATRLPTERELEAMARAVILDWTVRRMERSVRDVSIARLSAEYAKRKLKDPLARFQTTGMRTGALRDAVAEAQVIYQ